MLCENCGKEIPSERLETLPHTKTCVSCSTEKPKIAFNVFSHKTAPEIAIIPSEDKESVRRAKRANRRDY